MMKVNFNVPFKNYDGKDLVNQSGRPEMIKDIVAAALFNGNSLRYTGNPEEVSRKKQHAYALSQSVMSAVADIDEDDKELILESVSDLTAGCYSQIVQLLTFKNKELWQQPKQSTSPCRTRSK